MRLDPPAAGAVTEIVHDQLRWPEDQRRRDDGESVHACRRPAGGGDGEVNLPSVTFCASSPAGTLTLIEVAVTTPAGSVSTEPNRTTRLATSKPVPANVTSVPCGPIAGVNCAPGAANRGAATTVNVSSLVAVPPAVETVIATRRDLTFCASSPAGTLTRIDVAVTATGSA